MYLYKRDKFTGQNMYSKDYWMCCTFSFHDQCSFRLAFAGCSGKLKIWRGDSRRLEILFPRSSSSHFPLYYVLGIKTGLKEMNSLGVDPCRFLFIRLLYLHNSEMCKDSRGGGRSGYGDPSSSALQMSMAAKTAEWGERKATLECSASYVIFKVERIACKLKFKQKQITSKV